MAWEQSRFKSDRKRLGHRPERARQNAASHKSKSAYQKFENSLEEDKA